MASEPAATLHIAGLRVPYSFISLVTLTLQNSALAILLHYSRTAPDAKPYSAPAAVLLNEILKGSICFSIALNNVQQRPASEPSATLEKREDAEGSPSANKVQSHGRSLSMSVGSGRTRALQLENEEQWKHKVQTSASHATLLSHPSKWYFSQDEWQHRIRVVAAECFSPDCWKLAVPASLYVLQNNLQFVAASNLDVATFQVSYQAKILTTAFFSVTMLHKRLSLSKWLCLAALAIGVAIVQLQDSPSPAKHGGSPASMDRLTGFAAIVMACLTSGFAGVYFERVLKGSKADLWIRNIQLTIFSLAPALVAVLFPNFSLRDFLSTEDAPVSSPNPDAPTWIFGNFGTWAIATVLCQTIGGLVTALVIQYSDSIAKGFATSLSIIISFAAGVILFEFEVTRQFLLGGGIVLAATYYYNLPDRVGIQAPQSINYQLISGDEKQPHKSILIPATPPRKPSAANPKRSAGRHADRIDE